MLGKLYKFSPDGETITFDAREGGRRDISANELARIYINPGAARSVYNNILRAGSNQPVATTGVVNAPPGSIAVVGNQPWTDTQITVKKGDRIVFSVTGEVRVASGNAADAVAGPDGPPGSVESEQLSLSRNGRRRVGRQGRKRQAVRSRFHRHADQHAGQRTPVSRHQRRRLR